MANGKLSNGIEVSKLSDYELQLALNEVNEKIEKFFNERNPLKMKNQIDLDKELLNSDEVTYLLGIRYSTYQDLLRKGTLKGYKLGKRIYCKKSEIMESLKPMQQAEA